MVEEKQVSEETSPASHTIVSKNSSSHNGIAKTVVGAIHSKDQLNVRVSPECKSRLKWIAEELEATECSVVEAGITSMFWALKGKVEPLLLGKNVYISQEITFQRVTERFVRTMKGVVHEGTDTSEKHGSKEKCWACNQKPVTREHRWTARNKCHIWFCCKDHKPSSIAPLFNTGFRKL